MYARNTRVQMSHHVRSTLSFLGARKYCENKYIFLYFRRLSFTSVRSRPGETMAEKVITLSRFLRQIHRYLRRSPVFTLGFQQYVLSRASFCKVAFAGLGTLIPLENVCSVLFLEYQVVFALPLFLGIWAKFHRF